MNQPSTLFDRLDQAAKLSRQLTGKAAARTVCDAFVTERIADIKELHQSGVSLARYARLVAPVLGVRPSALRDALRRAGFAATALASVSGAAATPAAPAVERRRAARPAASSVPASAGVPGLELPDWADGSDRMADESEADYILRKHIEGPPAAGFKAIGESPAERADALLKALDFGAAGVTESDRKIVIALIERCGADAVERRIDSERKALPPGGKLYPSTLRSRTTGDGHA